MRQSVRTLKLKFTLNQSHVSTSIEFLCNRREEEKKNIVESDWVALCKTNWGPPPQGFPLFYCRKNRSGLSLGNIHSVYNEGAGQYALATFIAPIKKK